MEALCWLLFEADRPELILAQAYHCHRRARAAQLAEAGASDTYDESGQASAHMQALIQYGQQLGHFFRPGGRRLMVRWPEEVAELLSVLDKRLHVGRSLA